MQSERCSPKLFHGLDHGETVGFSLPGVLAGDMRRQARAANGVNMFPVSAFRSLEYQANLLSRKIDRGMDLEEILHVSAAPGYSEHHSGCAIDIDAGKGEPLEESFEDTDVFAWLTAHATEFGFRMSFPRDNPHGIAYEPWHWTYTTETWMLNLY